MPDGGERDLAAWDLVFCGPNGAPLSAEADWADWRAVLAAAGIRGLPGCTTPATQLPRCCSNRASTSASCSRSSASQLRMTERYTHVTEKLTQLAAKRMAEALWG